MPNKFFSEGAKVKQVLKRWVSKVSASVLAMSVCTCLVSVQPSRAIVGSMSLNPLVMSAGVLLIVSGGGLGMFSALYPGLNLRTERVLGGVTAAVTGAAGIFLLDDTTGGLRYRRIDPNSEFARSRGISPNEARSFNASLIVINTVLSDLVAHVQSAHPTTNEELIEVIGRYSKSEWIPEEMSLSPLALSALQKISR